MRTTSECDESKTLTSLMAMRMSPTWRPDSSAGVPGSMAETTTGRDPWIRNPNSPDWRFTMTTSSHSVDKKNQIQFKINLIKFKKKYTANYSINNILSEMLDDREMSGLLFTTFESSAAKCWQIPKKRELLRQVFTVHEQENKDNKECSLRAS